MRKGSEFLDKLIGATQSLKEPSSPKVMVSNDAIGVEGAGMLD
jgi:hypothetical protein